MTGFLAMSDVVEHGNDDNNDNNNFNILVVIVTIIIIIVPTIFKEVCLVQIKDYHDQKQRERDISAEEERKQLAELQQQMAEQAVKDRERYLGSNVFYIVMYNQDNFLPFPGSSKCFKVGGYMYMQIWKATI